MAAHNRRATPTLSVLSSHQSDLAVDVRGFGEEFVVGHHVCMPLVVAASALRSTSCSLSRVVSRVKRIPHPLRSIYAAGSHRRMRPARSNPFDLGVNCLTLTMYTRYTPQLGRDRSAERARTKSIDRAMSPIVVNIGGMPYCLPCSMVAYRLPVAMGRLPKRGSRSESLLGSGSPLGISLSPASSGTDLDTTRSGGLCLAEGLAFCSSLPCLLPFLRKDNQRKGKSEWVRLSQGWESQTRKDNRRMRASLG